MPFTMCVQAWGAKNGIVIPQPFTPESDISYSKRRNKESPNTVASLIEINKNTKTQRPQVIEVLTSWCLHGDFGQQNLETLFLKKRCALVSSG